MSYQDNVSQAIGHALRTLSGSPLGTMADVEIKEKYKEICIKLTELSASVKEHEKYTMFLESQIEDYNRG